MRLDALTGLRETAKYLQIRASQSNQLADEIKSQLLARGSVEAIVPN